MLRMRIRRLGGGGHSNALERRRHESRDVLPRLFRVKVAQKHVIAARIDFTDTLGCGFIAAITASIGGFGMTSSCAP